MFEGAVAGILNRLLGKYVQDLDTENLNVGIFSGNVNLTDLKLKPEALYELDFPIDVKIGTIGRINFQIPWAALYTQPVVVHIDDVLVLVGPAISNSHFDPEREKRLMRAAKRKILHDLEAESEILKGPQNFFEQLFTAIVNNLQIYVRNVHVRYEDSISSKDGPLACGLCLQSLSIETTNSKWKPSVTPENASTVYQMLRIESLSAYWNPTATVLDDTEIANITPMQYYNWKHYMLTGLGNFSMHHEGFDFLLKPVTCKVKLIMNRSSEARVPRLLLDAVLQDSAFQLSRRQYLSIDNLLTSFKRIQLNRKYRHLHPGVPLTKDIKKWWRYAYNSVVEQRVRPYTWTSIKKHRENYNVYKKIYKSTLKSPNDIELKLDLQKSEDNLPIISVVIAREQAKFELISEEPDRIEVVESEYDWWSPTADTKDDSDTESPKTRVELFVKTERSRSLWSHLSSPEKKRVCELIGYVEGEPRKDKSKRYIEHKLNLTLANCSLTLMNRGKEILVLTLTQFLASLETRPSAQAYKLSCRTESILVEGISSDGELVPMVTAVSSSNLLAVDVERRPASSEADYALTWLMEPLEVVYVEHAITELINILQIHSSLELPHHSSIFTAANLSRLTSRRTLLQLNVDLKAINVQYANACVPSRILIVDLTKVTIKSDLQPSQLALEDATCMELEERLYDRLHAECSLQVLFCECTEKWQEMRRHADSELHLIPRVKAQLVFSNTIKKEYKLLPRYKLNISLSSIKLNVSDRIISCVLDFLESLPLPAPNTVAVSCLDSGDYGDEIIEEDMLLDKVEADPGYRELVALRRRIVAACLSKNKPDSTLDKAQAQASFHARAQTFSSSTHSHSEEELELFARAVDLPGFDDNVSPSNTINTLLRFVVGEVVINLARSMDQVDRPYLMLSISKICLDVALMEYGPALQLSVGEALLTDKQHHTSDGQYLELITTSGELLNVIYRKVRADCPEFRSHFHGVETALVCDAGGVRVALHAAAARAAAHYASYVASKVISRRSMEPRACLAWLRTSCSRVLPAPAAPAPPVPPGATKFSYSVRIASLSVKLCHSDSSLIDIRLGMLESDCVFRANDKLVFKMALNSIHVDDLSDTTLYSKLVWPDEDKVLEAKYIAGGALRVRLGRLHVVLAGIWPNVQQFLEPLIPSAAAASSLAFDKYVDILYNKLKSDSNKTNLAIEIQAPVLLIPQKASSPDLLVLSMGDLTIENFFKPLPLPADVVNIKNAFIDNILVKWQHITLCRAVMTLAGTLELQEPILEPLSIRSDIKRALCYQQLLTLPAYRQLLLIESDTVVDAITINLGQRDLATIFAILTCWPIYIGEVPAGSPVEVSQSDASVSKLEQFLAQGEPVRRELAMRCSIEGFSLQLFLDLDEVLSSPVRQAAAALAALRGGELALSAARQSDGALDAAASLHSLLLEDVSAGRGAAEDCARAVTRIFQSAGNWRNTSSMIAVSRAPLLEAVLRVRRATPHRAPAPLPTPAGHAPSGHAHSSHAPPAAAASLDVRLDRARLNFSMPFFIKLLKALAESLPGEKSPGGGVVNPGYVDAPSDTSGYCSQAMTLHDDASSLSISIQLCQPEIMFFTDSTKTDGHALLLRTELMIDYSSHSNTENLVVTLSNLQIMSKLQSKLQNLPPQMVLRPCDVEFTKSLKNIEEGVKAKLTFSEIELHIAPSTVYTVIDIIEELRNEANSLDDKYIFNFANSSPKFEREDLWSPKKMSLKMKCTCKDNYMLPRYCGALTENYSVVLPSVKVLFEVEQAVRVPVGFVELSFELHMQEWSTSPTGVGSLTLSAFSYNEKIHVWEPVIEPVVVNENECKPWELNFELAQGESHPMSARLETDQPTQSDTEIDGSITSKRSRKKPGFDSETSADEAETDSENIIIRNPYGKKSFNEYDVGRNVDFEVSDEEDEGGLMDKLSTAVGHLFTDDSSSSDASDDEHSSEHSASEHEDEKAVSFADGIEKDSVEDKPDNLQDPPQCSYWKVSSPHPLQVSLQAGAWRGATAFCRDVRTRGPPATVLVPAAKVQLVNDVGPGSTVHLRTKAETDLAGNDKILAVADYDVDTSRPSTPGSVADILDEAEVETKEEPTDIGDDWECFEGGFPTGGPPSPMGLGGGIHCGPLTTEQLEKRIMDETLAIKLHDFDDLVIPCPQRTMSKLHVLHPSKNNTRYYIVVERTSDYCSKTIVVRSPLQIRNETSYPLEIYYDKTCLASIARSPHGRVANPFAAWLQLTVLAPSDTYNVPLYVANHARIFVLPVLHENYQISSEGIWWMELGKDLGSARDITCLGKEKQDSLFALRVLAEEGCQSPKITRSIPNYLLRVVPPLAIYNRLPFSINITSNSFDTEIFAGDRAYVYTVKLADKIKVDVMLKYLTVQWTGSFVMTPDVTDKILHLATDSETDSNNISVSINVRIDRLTSWEMYIYSPYWVVNKTQLPMQIKASNGPHLELVDGVSLWGGGGGAGAGGGRWRARVPPWGWSRAARLPPAAPAPLLAPPRYPLAAAVTLSELCPQLTKIMTFLPQFLVYNETRRHLRFMEEDEAADLWLDVAPSQVAPLCGRSRNKRAAMRLKYRDSPRASSAFRIDVPHFTALRMDRGTAVCVEVTGGTAGPFIVTFKIYNPGDAPVRVDNLCDDLFLKLHQEDCGQVALLSPYQSLLYTWDDPMKERKLLWNIYNNKGKGFYADFLTDGFGEEKVCFHSVKNSTLVATNSVTSKLSSTLKKLTPKSPEPVSSSSDDSDSSGIPEVYMKAKKMRKDKVVVYWISYMEDYQRVFVLTQDERTAYQCWTEINSERSTYEVCFSLPSVGVSVCIDSKNKVKELAYISVADSIPRWEVNVSSKWKQLTPELTTWIEDKYQTEQRKCQIKDYVHIDLEKMQMTKPFFAELRRSYNPGVWMHLRNSETCGYYHLKLQSLQIDNQLHEAVFPSVLHPSPLPQDLKSKHPLKPSIEVLALKQHRPTLNQDIYKYLKVLVQEYNVNLDRGFVNHVFDMLNHWKMEEKPAVRLRADLQLVHLPLYMIALKSQIHVQRNILFEYVHLSPIKLSLSLSSRGYSEENDRSTSYKYGNRENRPKLFNSDLLEYLFNSWGSSLCDMKDVVLRMPYFEARNMPISASTVMQQASRHYWLHLIQQFYVLVLGLNILGNPHVGDFTKGLKHYYEPCLGSIGKVVTSCFEAIFPRSRPTSVTDTPRLRGKRRADELLEKINDLPLSVVERDSNSPASIALALTGLIARPSLDICRMASKSSFSKQLPGAAPAHHWRRATEGTVVSRRRLPRFCSNIEGIQPYSGHAALGLQLLRAVSAGGGGAGAAGGAGAYVAHAQLSGSTALLLSDECVYLLRARGGAWRAEWSARLHDVIPPPTTFADKLAIYVKQDELVNYYSNDEKIIDVPDPEVLEWLKSKIEYALVIASENSRCKSKT